MQLDYWELVQWVMIPAILYASWIDIAQRKVPNWLNASILLAGFIAQFTYFGWGGVGWGALGMLVGFGVLIGPWLMHGMGAGDVKLMAAIGVWIGPWYCLWSFAVGAVIGGIAAVIMTFSTGRTVHALTNLQTIRTKLSTWDTTWSEYGGAKTFGDSSMLLPYGVPLTAGTIVVLMFRTLFGG